MKLSVQCVIYSAEFCQLFEISEAVSLEIENSALNLNNNTADRKISNVFKTLPFEKIVGGGGIANVFNRQGFKNIADFPVSSAFI